MKNIFKQFLLCTAALLAMQAAAADQSMPSGCPSAASIASVGVKEARSANDNVSWIVFEPANSYQTNRTWTFYIERLRGESASEVLTKVNAALPKMVLTDAGRNSGQGGEVSYYCLYEHEANEELIGIAFTPVRNIEELHQIMKGIKKGK